jgi:hypothetical protein
VLSILIATPYAVNAINAITLLPARLLAHTAYFA